MYHLVSDIIQETVGAVVKPEVRETVEAVRSLTRQSPDDEVVPASVTVAQLARDLDLDKFTVSRRVSQIRHDDYLRNLEDRRGKPAQLVIGEPLPEALDILPPPEVLHRCTQVGDSANPLPLPHPGNAPAANIRPDLRAGTVGRCGLTPRRVHQCNPNVCPLARSLLYSRPSRRIRLPWLNNSAR